MAEMDYNKAWDYVKKRVSEMETTKDEKEPGYITRLKNEIVQTRGRYKRLRKIIVKRIAGTLEFEPKCSLALMETQLKAMGEYLKVLEVRAELEEIGNY